MEILIYQIAIGSIILISGVFGRSTRNNIVLVLCLFTVIQIFMLWLAILQFITIIAAYLISNSYVDTNFNKKIALENKEKIVEQPKRKNNIYYILFVIISAIFFSVFVNLTRHKTKKLVENQKITSIEDSLNKSPELKIVSTLNNIPENNTYIDTTSELGPRVEYLKDLINYTEYCIHPNLSNYYDYKVSVKKIKDEEDNLKIKKIIVEIINKSSNITQQTIIINQKNLFISSKAHIPIVIPYALILLDLMKMK